MFEKEAEEYASNVFNPVQEKFFITRGLVQGHIAVAFKDGAEFGYNKAKEEASNLIEELASSLSVVGECGEEECELINKAQKFINKPIF